MIDHSTLAETEYDRSRANDLRAKLDADLDSLGDAAACIEIPEGWDPKAYMDRLRERASETGAAWRDAPWVKLARD